MKVELRRVILEMVTDMPQQWLKFRFCLLQMMTSLTVEMLSHLKVEIVKYTDTELHYITWISRPQSVRFDVSELCCVDKALDKTIKK